MAKPTVRENEPLPQDEAFVSWSKRLRKSDERAFSELFEAMQVRLLQYAFGITRDREVARDIVQDTFLKLWQIRETVDPARSLKALLYTIVRNLALNSQRAAGRTNGVFPEHGIADPAPSADESVHADLVQKALYRFIDELPERRRMAFVLTRFEGLSHDEVAQAMNLTPRTVNTHIVLAMKDLRKRMKRLQSGQTP